jgi:hypothetical protein
MKISTSKMKIMDFKKLLLALLIFSAGPALAQTASEQYGSND